MPVLKPTTMPATLAPADFIAGMAKGLAVLESFDTQRQRLNATLTAQRTGLTRAAARRHLLTLAHLGYLETDGSYYWLSAKVLRFSGSYLASAQLPRTVMPTLHQMTALTQDAFSVVVLDEDEVVIVARSDARYAAPRSLVPSLAPVQAQSLAYGLHLGARLPAHATSTGRVLLAAKPLAELDAWLQEHTLTRLTAKTTTDIATLRALIDKVRIDDHCLAQEEHELGVLALAVPLRNMKGVTVAALNVVATTEVSAAMLLRERLPLLNDAARALRAML